MVKNTSIPIINLINEVDDKIKNSDVKKVLLLSSEPTYESNLYQNVAKNEYEIIPPKRQKNVNKVIHNIMGGTVKQSDKQDLIFEAEYAKKMGCTGIIVGCTEIPILFNKIKTGKITVFDSVKILVDRTIDIAEED